MRDRLNYSHLAKTIFGLIGFVVGSTFNDVEMARAELGAVEEIQQDRSDELANWKSEMFEIQKLILLAKRDRKSIPNIFQKIHELLAKFQSDRLVVERLENFLREILKLRVGALSLGIEPQVFVLITYDVNRGGNPVLSIFPIGSQEKKWDDLKLIHLGTSEREAVTLSRSPMDSDGEVRWENKIRLPSGAYEIQIKKTLTEETLKLPLVILPLEESTLPTEPHVQWKSKDQIEIKTAPWKSRSDEGEDWFTVLTVLDGKRVVWTDQLTSRTLTRFSLPQREDQERTLYVAYSRSYNLGSMIVAKEIRYQTSLSRPSQ